MLLGMNSTRLATDNCGISSLVRTRILNSERRRLVTYAIFILLGLGVLYPYLVEIHSSRYITTGNNGAVVASITKPTLNPYPFKFIIPGTPCQDEHVVFVVHSAVKYFDRRMSMRSTWLNQTHLESSLSRKVKILFITGDVTNSSIKARVTTESEKYGDIIQSNFIDHYRNNTYKAISSLRWVSTYCSDASLVVKIDDDALIHSARLPKLKRLIDKLIDSPHKDIYSGRTFSRNVHRDATDKWYVSREEWKDDLYPIWFQGLAYFLTPHLAAKLVPLALTTKYLFTDDVYIGVLVNQVPEAKVVIDNSITRFSMCSLDTQLSYFQNTFSLFYHVPDIHTYTTWFHRTDVKKLQPSDEHFKDLYYSLVVKLYPFMLFLIMIITFIVLFFDLN